MNRLRYWIMFRSISCPVHGWPEYRTLTGNKGCWLCRRKEPMSLDQDQKNQAKALGIAVGVILLLIVVGMCSRCHFFEDEEEQETRYVVIPTEATGLGTGNAWCCKVCAVRAGPPFQRLKCWETCPPLGCDIIDYQTCEMRCRDDAFCEGLYCLSEFEWRIEPIRNVAVEE